MTTASILNIIDNLMSGVITRYKNEPLDESRYHLFQFEPTIKEVDKDRDKQ